MINSITVEGQLVALSQCICPGLELRLQCTVVGGTNTIWTGSALNDCGGGGEILLRHSQFEHGAVVGTCNDDESVIAQWISKDDQNFTSQLIVYLDAALNGATVECIFDDGWNEMVTGTYTITYSESMYMK